jgi:hypothetical protein
VLPSKRQPDADTNSAHLTGSFHISGLYPLNEDRQSDVAQRFSVANTRLAAEALRHIGTGSAETRHS